MKSGGEGPFHEARTAYVAGEHSRCLEIINAGIAAGDDDCRAYLGTLYLEGAAGLAKDLERGIALLEEAADATNIRAISTLGHAFFTGSGGVPKDPTRGFQFMRRASFMGHIASMYQLAQMYLRYGDRLRAQAWLAAAADYGHEGARGALVRAGALSAEARQHLEFLQRAISALQLMVDLDPSASLERIHALELEDIPATPPLKSGCMAPAVLLTCVGVLMVVLWG